MPNPKQKKELDIFDATTPEEVQGTWTADLIYNSKIVGTIFGLTEREIKKYVRRWVQQVPSSNKP